MEVPEVSVIIPVHDTMPYLVECLDSLLAQTILETAGAGSVEVLLVDDGSTDDGPAVMASYAAAHPGLFRVFTQPASGGPAVPRNRGLDEARGRYLYFLDADDYLAAYALERLVAYADEQGADVAFGRMVGVNGRWVDQRIYTHTRTDIDLSDPLLPFALSITKLFRRTLVEEHGLRFDPTLRIGSDQPFTFDALLAAARIMVLADDVYYYAVRRDDASNITYASGWQTRLRDTARLLHHVAERVPPGDLRDNVLHRHFAWELDKLLERTWPELDSSGRAELMAGVGDLATAYLTEGVARRLSVATRLRMRLAEAGDGPGLDALMGSDPPLVIGEGQAWLAYPGYGTRPDSWFEVTSEQIGARLELLVTGVSWRRTTLEVRGSTPLAGLAGLRFALLRMPKGNAVPGVRRFARGEEPPGRSWPASIDGGDFAGSLDVAHLLDADDPPTRRWALRLRLDVGDHTYDLPTVADLPSPLGTLVRQRLHLARLRVVADPDSRLHLTREP